MKRKISMLGAVMAIGLIMTTGNAVAVPGEVCEYDGQFAFTYETVGLNSGWQMWECWNEQWRYRGFCGNNPCQIP